MASKLAGRPRTKPAEVRRDELLRSAERLFLEKGFEQTTVEDITSEAAVSKGAFYLQFSSKADLVEALRSRFVQDLIERIDDGVGKQSDGDWNGKLVAWAEACAVGYLNEARLHRIIFAAALSPPRGGLTRNGLIDHLTGLLTAGNRDSAWALTDPSFTAIFLFNALHGVVNHDSFAADEHKRATTLSALATHFLGAVR